MVVGGGNVGRRKARGLLAAGGRVRLVCLEPRPPEDHSGDLEWIESPYQPDHLEGADLVLAAATQEVNRQVVADARERGLWVCSSTDPDSGDFVTASVIRRGEVTVALGTGGAVPALTRALRQHLDALLEPEIALWAELLAELRSVILESVSDPGARQRLWERLCDRSWLCRLRDEGVDRVREAMRSAVVEAAG